MGVCSRADWLKMRRPAAHSRKGDNGKLLILAGNEKYHGSAILAILAAVRFCDLVYFHSTAQNQELAKKYIEKIKASTPCVICGKRGELPRHMKTADAILIGPGIGRSAAAGKLVSRAIFSGKAVVLDADALHLIGPSQLHRNCLLTPHEGEFQSLFGMPGSIENVRRMAKKHSCTILKKGKVDIIASPGKLKLNRTHNAGMTKGGTGDVLAGLAGALVASGNPIFESACAAAYLNGLAGNLLRKKYGFHYSAHDLAEALGASAALLEK